MTSRRRGRARFGGTAIAAGLLFALAFAFPPKASAEAAHRVEVRSGGLVLRGVLWRPPGRGPFPAVLYEHGSGSAFARERYAIGPVFARHGYVFLILFRRGAGLSAGAAEESGSLMRRELANMGQDARNRLQIRLLETRDMEDALAGLAYLRRRGDVDTGRIAVAGHSFGGSLALLVAERDPNVRAVVDFAGAAGSWPDSPPLRERLHAAVTAARCPVFFIHARNDFSTAPGEELAAEMETRGKPHRLRIYPPCGETPEAGHDFVYRQMSVWEPDVFAFLQTTLGS